MVNIEKRLEKELGIKLVQVQNVIKLLDEGNTVPFIARYRKEQTGALSDDILRKFFERLTYLRNLKDRKEDVLRLIDEQGKLTEEIVKALEKADSLTEVEDIYRPFKPKKRTRATIALEKGLKPLADIILAGTFNGTVEKQAEAFINEEKAVNSIEDAIAGALDIIAEGISDDAALRKYIRNIVFKEGKIETKGSSEESTPYEMYYDYSEDVFKIPSHRILAMNRGEKEKILSVKISVNDEKIISYIESKILKENSITAEYLKVAIKDSYKRLIFPSIEREIRNELTDKGEEGAILIFKENLKALLMQPPIKGKVVMGYDPGFRTGCKVAVLDATGRFLDKATVYPTVPKRDIEGTKEILKEMIKKYNVDVISLGNGTASRESEEVIAEIISEIKNETGKGLAYVIVSEAGASVYSASELAAKEYPDLDVTIRGAISIGRRLQDPMAELVKIEPKAIGVGQYQYDVTQSKLSDSLDFVVETAVNSVGVNINSASIPLLQRVSGLNAKTAKLIVDYRDQNGEFKTRQDIKIKGIGPKTLEQAIGFLRIPNGDEKLDMTSIHPESYKIAEEILAKLGFTKNDIGTAALVSKINKLNRKEFIKEFEVGEYTFNDILDAFVSPLRDPRDKFDKPVLRSDVLHLEDLKPGMELQGTVRNVVDFGAFVDCGVKEDGLVHLSRMSKKFIKHPLDVVSVGDIIKVWVVSVNLLKGRVELTMLAPNEK